MVLSEVSVIGFEDTDLKRRGNSKGIKGALKYNCVRLMDENTVENKNK